MKFFIKDVNVEFAGTGRNKYQVANVEYTYNGEPRSKKIMSFANPAVFKQVQEVVGQEVDVTVGKNDKGYDEWKAINAEGTASSAAGTAPTSGNVGLAAAATRTVPSTYETKEERAVKQVYIVKQSSLSNAVNILSHANKDKIQVEEVLELAQVLTDFVFDTPKPE